MQVKGWAPGGSEDGSRRKPAHTGLTGPRDTRQGHKYPGGQKAENTGVRGWRAFIPTRQVGKQNLSWAEEGERESCRQSDLDKGPGAHRPTHRGQGRVHAEMDGEGLE